MQERKGEVKILKIEKSLKHHKGCQQLHLENGLRLLTDFPKYATTSTGDVYRVNLAKNTVKRVGSLKKEAVWKYTGDLLREVGDIIEVRTPKGVQKRIIKGIKEDLSIPDSPKVHFFTTPIKEL